MTDLRNADTGIQHGPMDKAAALDDMSRRYDLIKERIQEIGIINRALGTPVFTFGITVSSRFKLRAMIIDSNSGEQRGELRIGVGEEVVKEKWVVNGKVV
jgi:hypothetical protein